MSAAISSDVVPKFLFHALEVPVHPSALLNYDMHMLLGTNTYSVTHHRSPMSLVLSAMIGDEKNKRTEKSPVHEMK